MLEGVQEAALAMDEMQDTTDLYLAKLLKERMVHGLVGPGILQGPVDLAAAVRELEMRILASGDALIDHREAIL
ncbi:MAG TPA: hypothetical protein VIH59_03810 [Candidatus Tectomicrobia bacterium]